MAFAVADKPEIGTADVREGRISRVALVQATQAIGTETFDPRDDNLAKAMSAIDRAADDGAAARGPAWRRSVRCSVPQSLDRRLI